MSTTPKLIVEIKNRFTSAVLYSHETTVERQASWIAMRDALEAAVASNACLSGANLSRAYLSGADLSRADLSRADLSGAYLSGADLSRAYLSGADLSRADLSRADLSDAYLSDADLSGADLSDAKGTELVIAMTRILPEGELIGWKKCGNGAIVKLRIPADAKRSHAFGRKCRAEFADVLEVFGAEFGVTDAHGPRTVYRVGQRVMPDSWHEDWQEECANGIHFFITRLEAEDY